MPPELARILCAVFVVWSLAVVVKAGIAVRRGEPYVFSMWDGGAIRAGKKLTEVGAHVKIATGILTACCLTALAARIVPYRIAFPALVVVVAVGVLCDFVLTAKE